MLVGVGGNHGCTVFRVFSSGWGGGTQKLKLRRESCGWEGGVLVGKSRWGSHGGEVVVGVRRRIQW